MLEKYGGRKVVLGLILALIGVAVDMVAKGGLSGNLLELLKYIGGGFFLGNGIEHIAGAVASRSVPAAEDAQEAPAPAPVAPSPAPVPSPVVDHTGQLDTIAAGVMTVQQTLQWIIQTTGMGQNKA